MIRRVYCVRLDCVDPLVIVQVIRIDLEIGPVKLKLHIHFVLFRHFRVFKSKFTFQAVIGIPQVGLFQVRSGKGEFLARLSYHLPILILLCAKKLTALIHVDCEGVVALLLSTLLSSEKLPMIQNVVSIALMVRFIVKVCSHSSPQTIHLIMRKFQIIALLYEIDVFSARPQHLYLPKVSIKAPVLLIVTRSLKVEQRVGQLLKFVMAVVICEHLGNIVPLSRSDHRLLNSHLDLLAICGFQAHDPT